MSPSTFSWSFVCQTPVVLVVTNTDQEFVAVLTDYCEFHNLQIQSAETVWCDPFRSEPQVSFGLFTVEPSGLLGCSDAVSKLLKVSVDCNCALFIHVHPDSLHLLQFTQLSFDWIIIGAEMSRPTQLICETQWDLQSTSIPQIAFVGHWGILWAYSFQPLFPFTLGRKGARLIASFN